MMATDTNINGTVIETKEMWRVYKVGTQEVPALRGVNLKVEPTRSRRHCVNCFSFNSARSRPNRRVSASMGRGCWGPRRLMS